jgi:hypothetical protein
VSERRELGPLLRSSYDLVLATLPKSKRPGAAKRGETHAGLKPCAT